MRPRIDLTAATWRKSSYSNSDGGNCVEVADGFLAVVPVRDSKRPDGAALIVPADSWTAMLGAMKASRLPS
jgi:hypothetical protein